MILTSPSGERFFVFVLGEKLEDCSHQIAQLVLENNSFNQTHTAKALGIATRTVRHWINKGYLTTVIPRRSTCLMK